MGFLRVFGVTLGKKRSGPLTLARRRFLIVLGRLKPLTLTWRRSRSQVGAIWPIYIGIWLQTAPGATGTPQDAPRRLTHLSRARNSPTAASKHTWDPRSRRDRRGKCQNRAHLHRDSSSGRLQRLQGRLRTLPGASTTPPVLETRPLPPPNIPVTPDRAEIGRERPLTRGKLRFVPLPPVRVRPHLLPLAPKLM